MYFQSIDGCGWLVRSEESMILINPTVDVVSNDSVKDAINAASETVVVLATDDPSSLDLEALYSLPRDTVIVAPVELPHALECALEFVNLRVSAKAQLGTVRVEQSLSGYDVILSQGKSVFTTNRYPRAHTYVEEWRPGTWHRAEAQTYSHRPDPAARPARMSQRSRRAGSYEKDLQTLRDARTHLQTRAPVITDRLLRRERKGQLVTVAPGTGPLLLYVELCGGPARSRFRYALDSARAQFVPADPARFDSDRTVPKVVLHLEDYAAVIEGAALMSDLYPDHLQLRGADPEQISCLLECWMDVFGPLHLASSVTTYFRTWAHRLMIADTLEELGVHDA